MDGNSNTPDIDEAEAQIARDQHRRTMRWRLQIAAAVAMLGLGYVLSPAGYLYLAQEGMLPIEVVHAGEVVYWPLSTAYDHFAVVSWFYDFYFSLMGVHS